MELIGLRVKPFKVTNKVKTLLGILIFLTLLYGMHFILKNPYKIINNSSQLVEASNLYNEPDIPPEILIISPVSGSTYNILNRINICFSVPDINYLPEADIDGRKVENGDLIDTRELTIGKHTLTVKANRVKNPIENISLTSYLSYSEISTTKEVVFTVTPQVCVKDFISNKEGLFKLYIRGLGVENIYDKTIEWVYHNRVNNIEVGLNSDDVLISTVNMVDYNWNKISIPELQVSFRKGWIKDILDANPYAEFTLRLELKDGTVLSIPAGEWGRML